MGHRSRGAAAAPELDSHAAGLVVSRLGPWSRAHCACINQTWKRAAEEASFPDTANQHWLVDADGDNLWMLNLVSGNETVLKMDLPWASIPTNPRGKKRTRAHEFSATRVLCSFQGLLLVNLHRDNQHDLVLGDPLLNKWIKLPKPKMFGHKGFFRIAAFCSDTRTLMVSSDYSRWTATFDFASARWTVDPYAVDLRMPQSQACCVHGIFYCTFLMFVFEKDNMDGHVIRVCTIACYDPAGARQWQIVEELFVAPETYCPIFLAQSHGKLLVYKAVEGYYHLFEAQGSGELELMPSPLMDEHMIRLLDDVQHTCRRENTGMEAYPYKKPAFHGRDDMLFWESFDVNNRDKIKVLSLKDNLLRELKCSRENSKDTCTKFYYTAAPGTGELLDSLALKLEETYPAPTRIEASLFCSSPGTYWIWLTNMGTESFLLISDAMCYRKNREPRAPLAELLGFQSCCSR